MDNNGQKLYDWEDLLQKTTKAKAKAGLYPLSLMREIDQQVTCNKQSTKNTKASTRYQEAFIKDVKAKKPWL